MYKIVLTSLSIILLSSANSYSQNSQSEKTDTLNINYFIDNLTDRLEDFLASSGRGIEATNLWLQLHDRKPIYCPPENIVLTGKQYGQILRSIVEKIQLLVILRYNMFI